MIKNLLGNDEPEPSAPATSTATKPSSNPVMGLFDSGDTSENEEIVLSTAEPETTAETIIRRGHAYSAGIAFFAAVVFMLILGWGADVLLGTSPWGIVGGIVLGSIIGFVQFFRITSQIFKK